MSVLLGCGVLGSIIPSQMKGDVSSQALEALAPIKPASRNIYREISDRGAILAGKEPLLEAPLGCKHLVPCSKTPEGLKHLFATPFLPSWCHLVTA